MTLQLVIMILVRKLLDKVFSESELKILDDILPHFTRHERLDDEASCAATLIWCQFTFWNIKLLPTIYSAKIYKYII